MNKSAMAACAIAVALSLLGASASAKLPPPSDEAKAKAAETAAKAGWTDKVGSYKHCQAQDRVAAHYMATLKAAGKAASAPTATPPCADPGPFVYTPPAPPLEAAGAHSPPKTATSPPNTVTPAAQQPKK